ENSIVVRFARLFLSQATAEFFQQRTSESLADLVVASFEFLHSPKPRGMDVEVVNPDIADEGWTAPVTLIRSAVSERPFIVDSLREYLYAQEIVIERFVHPVLKVVRGEDGTVEDVGPAGAGEPRESLVHCEVPRIMQPERRERIREELCGVMRDVIRATDDFGDMLEALDETIAYVEGRAYELPSMAGELKEMAAFLGWLRSDGFVFLGYRGYDLVETEEGRAIAVEAGSGLGILRDETESSFAEPVRLSRLQEGLRERVEGGPLLIISKTNARSSVHRNARMDYVGVKKLDAQGRIVGERRFIGLFTSKGYAEDADRIPILRQKLRAVLDHSGLIPGTHDYKEMITIFNSMPKEELFLASTEEIERDLQTVLNLYQGHDVRVTLRADPLERGASLMVIMPKDKFSGEVRKSVQEAFTERFGGEVLNYHLALGSGDQARLHFYISAAEENTTPSAEELEQVVRELTRSWTDRVREALEQVRPGEEGRRLAARYGEAFAPEYRAATGADVAGQDILALESMASAGEDVAITLQNPDEAEGMAVDEPVTRLKLYLRGERLILSDFMPILDNAGLRVIAMSPFQVMGDDVDEATIYVFAVQDGAGRPVDLVEHGGKLAEAILAVRAGDATNDPLNQLLLSARLGWREVDVLRAYSEYAFQIGAVPSRLSLSSALRSYPGAAALLFQLFAVKFDPATEQSRRQRERSLAALQKEFVRSLEQVRSLADDRALRRLMALIEATVRTNYYRRGGAHPVSRSGGVPWISLKFACEHLPAAARTRLRYEVWVHSSRMAGVHLRGAHVARGGIRYSDRPDDFRTEILGLVKTQTVKNAVIVPAGSKGGFVVHRKFAERERMAEEVTAQYQTLIRGLLDLTDNLSGGEAVHPERVVTYDGPDPYLVVAADKGTAHLSDIANGVAAEYDFWLGDAFASGGSHGYDHKEVGITAKGGWECVRRHFREMGRDIQTEPFTVVGIGDMSGDVFGNGMLLSKAIRLLAAFDHRHIFVDPDPDPGTSYRERQRLFQAGRTSWADYDERLISEGGFVVPRGIKEVELSAAARKALGIPASKKKIDGESLIRAILSAPADLLWNGGIGTYVKASYETHADVGDSTNDAVRVDAPQLRVKVIGEGGNLGLTQEGRIQFALRGGRLNTDAIDNSGGVAMSDREVNLKILLNGVMAEGRLDFDERNRLLEAMTGEVEELVLHDNRSQSLAISLDEIRAEERGIEEFHELMVRLEKQRLLDRASEYLPSLEVLQERRTRGRSLTRPELSVLLAYSKLDLKQHLRAADFTVEPAVEPYLMEYFPPQAVEAAGAEALHGHRLRREIVASQIANDLVDLMGATFVPRIMRDTGAGLSEVVRAWLIAARLCGADELRVSLQEVETELPSAVIYRWLLGLARVLSRTARWVLGNVEAGAPASEVIAQHVEGLARLRERFGEIVAGEERGLFESRVQELQNVTEKHDLAQRLITLRFLDQLLEILRVARETG
ncbi:MAG TPA: NAD-glutamate dehydrogenase domain-containing protein, partial [Longimicrobiales bacterium]|nr:NAD-glutamate dehydrogenase domain-containing protein [Longimicrobiales bacterium]